MSALLIQEHVPLAPLSTIGVGGSARYYVRAANVEEARAAALWAHTKQHPVFVLGGGSNVVVADEGYPGLVLHAALRGVEFAPDGGRATITARAGEVWDDVVALAVDRGWGGIECLSGIPGRVGATPVQNVGAYGQEVADTIDVVEVLDLASGQVMTLGRDECAFGYRQSRFKGEDRGRFLISSVRYVLAPGAPPLVRYPDVARALAGLTHAVPTLAAARAAVLAVRREKAMAAGENAPSLRSAGSFFVNPELLPNEADEVEGRLESDGHLARGETLPRYPAGPDRVKLPAAWLIEHCGFPRGFRRGPVGLSAQHALAIVNHGGATARDVLALAREVRDRVRDGCGVVLVPEPVFVGMTFE